ncbi:MAG: hypothetical protein JRN21_09590 [Nitrososphaerota archaeon]|nr:hypothetical protein [Nitrososphaerota archaeon]
MVNQPESQETKTNVRRDADAKTVSLVEREIIESKNYETKEQVWKHFEGVLDLLTFESAIDQLLNAGKIMFDGQSIIYTGTNNTKLQALVDSSVSVHFPSRTRLVELAKKLRNAEDTNLRRGYAGEFAYYRYRDVDDVASTLEEMTTKEKEPGQMV